MKPTKTFLLAAGVLAASVLGSAETAEAKKKEKCYGVVKAGKNDCGNAQGTHSCAGQAKTDADGGEWLLLPEGVCDRIAGASTSPKV